MTTAPASTVSAPVIPWWKSRGVLWALSGMALAATDGFFVVISGGALTWRTFAIGIGGALALWFRTHATGVIRAVLTGEPPTPPEPNISEPRT
jgi:hypothetical protein